MALVTSGDIVPLLVAGDVPVPPILEERHAANKGSGGGKA